MASIKKITAVVLGLCGMLALSRPLLAQESPVSMATNTHRSFGSAEWPQALKMADFILSLQNSYGAIPSVAGGAGANQDSDMEYGLIGLGAAYAASGNVKYLTAFENGIKWLAAREEMNDPFWKGSWYYVYSVNPPFNEIPTSSGQGVVDVRGVDATSALFVYLLYLDQRLTGSRALADTYSANAQAALDFVINHNLDTDGLSWSSWLENSSGQWSLYKFKYAADQGDVYLGMQAGKLLYNSTKYGPIAGTLFTKTPGVMYSTTKKRYGQGTDDAGALDISFSGFCGIFPNGYLPWMWGNGTQNSAAEDWLDSRVQSDGSITAKTGAAKYSLSVAILGMASAALNEPEPLKSFNYLVSVPYDAATGGVHDTNKTSTEEYVNVAAFSLIGLLGFVPY